MVAFGIMFYRFLLWGQGIVNSVHDFSNRSWNTSGEICIVCHTPHSANQDVPNQPLWNHQTTTANFVTYSSATLDATVGQPTGPSKLCLSCHDGTVALDNFGGVNSGNTFISTSHAGYMGTDLSHNHPISFVYDASLALQDRGLKDPTTTTTMLGNTIDEDLLFNHRMECSTCHDVHKITCLSCHPIHGQPDGNLLRIPNTGSQLCLTCHDK
jgi:predicted CXXCH cytochrome family protein